MPAPRADRPDGPPAAGAGLDPDPRVPFAYAVLRIVPWVERGECLNAGVVLYCPPRRFLDARVALDRARLAIFAPGLDPEPLEQLLARVPRLCAGGPEAGPIGLLPRSERFHWLVAPSSTILQPSPVHPGLGHDPAATLDHLFRTMVLPRGVRR